MKRDIKKSIIDYIKKVLNEKKLVYSLSVDILANQFVETGNITTNGMFEFLKAAYKINDQSLANKLSEGIAKIIKSNQEL